MMLFDEVFHLLDATSLVIGFKNEFEKGIKEVDVNVQLLYD